MINMMMLTVTPLSRMGPVELFEYFKSLTVDELYAFSLSQRAIDSTDASYAALLETAYRLKYPELNKKPPEL